MDKPVDVVRLAAVKGGDGRKIDKVFLLTGRGIEGGKLPWIIGPVDVDGHPNSVPHFYEDIFLHFHPVMRWTQFALGEIFG